MRLLARLHVDFVSENREQIQEVDFTVKTLSAWHSTSRTLIWCWSCSLPLTEDYTYARINVIRHVHDRISYNTSSLCSYAKCGVVSVMTWIRMKFPHVVHDQTTQFQHKRGETEVLQRYSDIFGNWSTQRIFAREKIKYHYNTHKGVNDRSRCFFDSDAYTSL